MHYHIRHQYGERRNETIEYFEGSDTAFQRRFNQLSMQHGPGLVAERSEHPFPGSVKEEQPEPVKPRRSKRTSA
jgi:hypothetical protein